MSFDKVNMALDSVIKSDRKSSNKRPSPKSAPKNARNKGADVRKAPRTGAPVKTGQSPNRGGVARTSRNSNGGKPAVVNRTPGRSPTRTPGRSPVRTPGRVTMSNRTNNASPVRQQTNKPKVILQPAVIPNCQVLVKNVPAQFSEVQIRQAFSAVGEITYCSVLRDSNQNHSGMVIIRFAKPNMAKKAIDQFNGGKINDAKIEVVLDKTRV